MYRLLESFVQLEGRGGEELLRADAEQRRFRKRTLEFNCLDVEIDADARTVTLVDAIDLDGARAVIPLDELLRDLRDLSDIPE